MSNKNYLNVINRAIPIGCWVAVIFDFITGNKILGIGVASLGLLNTLFDIYTERRDRKRTIPILTLLDYSQRVRQIAESMADGDPADVETYKDIACRIIQNDKVLGCGDPQPLSQGIKE